MNAGVVENAPTLFSAWLRLFRYVAQTAAAEYEELAWIHTPLFGRFELNHPGPFSTLLFPQFELERPT